MGLSERLGGLPLALHHAGSQIASDFTAEQTFKQYADGLDRRFERLMGNRATGGRTIVTSTWELSLHALAARGLPQARPLLRILSFLAPAVLIPTELLDLNVLGEVCEDGPDGASEGLAALASVALITIGSKSPGIRAPVIVHPLVAETNRFLTDAESLSQISGITIAMLTVAGAGLRYDQSKDWPKWVQLVPHLNAVYRYLASRISDGDLAALMGVTVSAVSAFIWAGAYPASQELAASALKYANRLSADQPEVLSLRFSAASAQMYCGNYVRAEDEFRQVLAVILPKFGSDDLSTLTTRHEIARTLAARGQYKKAEQEYRSVLTGRRRVLGPDHPDTLATRHEIARTLAARGQYKKAEQEYRNILESKMLALGADHPDTLATRHEIAWVLAARGQYDEAEQGYRIVLTSRQRVLGADHPATLATRNQIAGILVNRGRRDEAEQEYRNVFAAKLRVLGPDHPSTRKTQERLKALEMEAEP